MQHKKDNNNRPQYCTENAKNSVVCGYGITCMYMY